MGSRNTNHMWAADVHVVQVPCKACNAHRVLNLHPQEVCTHV